MENKLYVIRRMNDKELRSPAMYLLEDARQIVEDENRRAGYMAYYYEAV